MPHSEREDTFGRQVDVHGQKHRFRHVMQPQHVSPDFPLAPRGDADRDAAPDRHSHLNLVTDPGVDHGPVEPLREWGCLTGRDAYCDFIWKTTGWGRGVDIVHLVRRASPFTSGAGDVPIGRRQCAMLR